MNWNQRDSYRKALFKKLNDGNNPKESTMVITYSISPN